MLPTTGVMGSPQVKIINYEEVQSIAEPTKGFSEEMSVEGGKERLSSLGRFSDGD